LAMCVTRAFVQGRQAGRRLEGLGACGGANFEEVVSQSIPWGRGEDLGWVAWMGSHYHNPETGKL